MPEAAPRRAAQNALIASIGCYVLWGLTPILFIALGRAGAGAWEIVGQRAVWSAPWAGVIVLLSGHGRQVLDILRRPGQVALLLVSSLCISTGWIVFVWSVNHGHNLEASLGYFINPLLNMAVGAVLFRERLDRFGKVAIALAVAGVALQTLALGHPPLISLVLAGAFTLYGLIRKRIAAEAQAGLFVETLIMAGPGLAYVVWLNHTGGARFGHGVEISWLLALTGPATVAPLALFAWSARRTSFSTMGFLQFIYPSISFCIGLAVGERLNPMGAASFAFIWTGAAVFGYGAWRAGRRERLMGQTGQRAS